MCSRRTRRCRKTKITNKKQKKHKGKSKKTNTAIELLTSASFGSGRIRLCFELWCLVVGGLGGGVGFCLCMPLVSSISNAPGSSADAPTILFAAIRRPLPGYIRFSPFAVRSILWRAARAVDALRPDAAAVQAREYASGVRQRAVLFDASDRPQKMYYRCGSCASTSSR